MKLSAGVNTPSVDPERLKIFLYGHPKVGKSTFCSCIPNHGYIPLGDEVSHLRVNVCRRPDGSNFLPRTFEEFLEVAGYWAADPTCKTVVIDTIGYLHDLIAADVIKNAGVETLGDAALAYGKGEALVKFKLKAVLDNLAAAGKGVVLVGHVDRSKIQTGNKEYDKWLPDLKPKVRIAIQAWADWIVYAFIEDKKEGEPARILALQPSPNWVAGGRAIGRVPYQIPLDWNEFAKVVTPPVKDKK